MSRRAFPALRRILAVVVAAQAVAATTALSDNLRLVAPLGGSLNIPTVSMHQARFLSTLRQQYDFSCGSAAVATLLTHHYGQNIGEAQVFQTMFEHGDQTKIRREGFSMLDMKRYLDHLDFTADGVQANLDQLAEAAVPAIALIQENGYAHFVVIKGLRNGRVLIGDPALGTRVISRKDFEQHWTNGILLVINARVELARFNLASDWRVRPSAPLARGLDGAAADVQLLRRGAWDY